MGPICREREGGGEGGGEDGQEVIFAILFFFHCARAAFVFHSRVKMGALPAAEICRLFCVIEQKKGIWERG